MTKAEELEHGTLSRVQEDEPLFVLRAKDAVAVEVVEAWVEAARKLGAPSSKIREAENLIARMRDWQKEHGTKTPD